MWKRSYRYDPLHPSDLFQRPSYTYPRKPMNTVTRIIRNLFTVEKKCWIVTGPTTMGTLNSIELYEEESAAEDTARCLAAANEGIEFIVLELKSRYVRNSVTIIKF
jgi:hypothetical protein